MNKKVKNILFAVLFAFTVVLAGFVIVDAIDNSNEGKITVNKTAVREDGEAGNETSGRNVNVTLSVTGNEFTTSTSLDVVLVLDRSSSMHNNGSTKLSDAKSAAVELVNDLFANNTEDRTVVRMGVVTFGKTVIDKWSNSTLSSNKNDVITKINAITSNDNDIPGNTNGQGTNVQSGLAKANALLANSTAKNKVVILLTDGAPSLFDYDGNILGTGNSDAEVCIEYTKEEVCYGRYCYETDVCAAKKKPSDAAKEEAEALKDDDVTIYSVGFGVKENFYDSNSTKESKKNARDFLQAVATETTAPYYLLAENADELSESFDDIVKSIGTIAKDVAVTDIVPAGFTVDETALKNTYGDKVSIAPGENGTTVITWDIGELTVTEDPILTYQVTAKDDYYGGMYTNVSAILTGTAVEGNPSYPDSEIEETFPLPEVAISKLTKNDSYTVKLGDTLTVNADKGILNNDSKTKVEDGEGTTVTDEIIITSASCGAQSDIKVNADGSFEYTPSSTCYDGQTNKVVFEYVVKSTVTINGEAETVTSNVSTITIDLTKDDSSLEDPTVTKTNNNGQTTTSITGPFSYTIDYSTTVENHIGSTTITIVDTLPYQLDETKANDLANGTYEYKNEVATITWVETINNIDSYQNKNNDINIEKTITVYYKDVPTDVEVIINNVSVTTDIDNTPTEGTEETIVERGNIVVEYVDNLGNTLLPSTTSEGLINTPYTTSANNSIVVSGIEYQLVATKVNNTKVEKTNSYSGTYEEGTTTITYVYYKVTGDIDNNNTLLTKEGPEKVTSSTGEFNYTINYSSKIDNYIGDATVTITDNLPLPIEQAKSDLNGGSYDAANQTITWIIPLNDINTYENGVYPINITKNIKVVFSGLDATKRELTNNVTAKLETSKSENEKETDEVTELEIKGTVIAHYVDTTGKTIETDEPQTGLVGNEYTTTAKTIDGYQLVDTDGATTGTYIEGTIDVTYIYYKVEGTITGDTITKKGTDEVDSVTDTFEYTITYTTTIDNYIGDATVTITDTLPLPIDEANSNLNGGTYKYEDGVATITWTESITDIDTNTNGAYNVEVTKNISVKYLELDPTTRELTNTVVATIETEVSEETTEPAEKDTAVKIEGTVIAHYVDTTGKTIATDEPQTGLVGNVYTTTAKTIAGYQLVRTDGEKTGTFIDGTIEVTYVYYKVEGNIADNRIIKTGTEEVDSVTDTFEYTITYTTTIDNYIGDATVTITDTLPLPIDEANSNLNGGTYEYKDGVATITWTESITDIDTNTNGTYNVAITKNISVKYLGLEPTTREVTNTVIATIRTDIKEVTTEPAEKDTTVSVNGTVIAHYVDTTGKTITTDEPQTGLVGNEYTTTAKTITGYQLVDTVGETTGTYIDGTIEVTYIYYRETGEIVGDTITKNGTDEVDSVTDTFEYEIIYNATIKDYIGNATVTITDTLPLPIDEANSNLNGGTYKYENGVATITWTETITGIDTNTNGAYNVEVTKNISVKYLGLDPTTRELTNTVIGTIETEVSEETTEPTEKDTAVKVEGTVIAHYVDTTGKTIATDITQTGLVGNEYRTTPETITGYQLVDTVGETTGTFIDGTIEVTYVYYKETGQITNEVVEKTGDETITLKDEKVNYNINYKAEINDYIGNATITIIDYLPYAIDITESNLNGGIYDEENLTITWTENIEGIDTYTSGESYKIELNKELLLTYIDLDLKANNITNKVSVTVKTDITEETSKDEFSTEIDVKGNVIVNYIDDQGNEIIKPITLTDKIGLSYETELKQFDDYELILIEGEPIGEFTEKDIIVTYIYTKIGKGGDVEVLPPQTGVNINEQNISLSILGSLLLGLFLIIKKFI